MPLEFDRLDKRYLGDGVYVYHDGYNIWAGAERDGRWHEVAFEPGLIEKLVAYQWDLKAKYAKLPDVEKEPK